LNHHQQQENKRFHAPKSTNAKAGDNDNNSKKLDWMPEGEPAWSTFTAGKEKILAGMGSQVGS